jgi:type IV pilus assembly protein PilW
MQKIWREGGHTLIELMLAMSLGLLVSCAVLSLYRDQRDTFARSADWASLTEAGHAALDLIAVQARLAGLVDLTDSAGPLDGADEPRYSGPVGSLPKIQRAPVPLAQYLPIFGCHAGRPTGAADEPRCEADSRGSDGVQFISNANPVSSWADSEGAATDCLGQALAAQAASVARFFVRVSSASGEPELYCDGGARLGNPQPVIEGVETLQLRYRLDHSEVPQALVAAALWPQVRALEVCLVVRGQPGHAHFPYVDCNGHAVTGADLRRRQVFRLFVALRNHPVSK